MTPPRGTARRWVRLPPEPRDTLRAGLLAGAVGAGVGLAAFYLTRLLLAREPLSGPPGVRNPDGAVEREGPGGA